MNLNTPEFWDIRNSWIKIDAYLLASLPRLTRDNPIYKDLFKVINKKGESVEIMDFYHWWRCPVTGKLAFRVAKDYWAKGRKMKIESKIPGILSGEYMIVTKAKSNSYDQEDFVVVEYINPTFDTPRKALNWLERQLAELEAQDGITTQQLVRDMKVQG